ncbi:methyl-accepting chemotaxis protein [Paraliobacillus zengyii]|uniref:methyl-accepting chemotaxis protein n=1 Tax=Paraliobacillus zengyii TaxID=2213194 RepID=UPI000DD32B89|nr:methyl-accepting chemotaxis protein [Paraliobacillus zengyii]
MKTIRGRMQAIILISILSIIVLSGLTLYFFNQQNQATKESEELQSALLDSERINYQVALTSEAEEQFYADPSEEHAELIKQSITTIQSEAVQLSNSYAAYPEIASDYAAISENATTYVNQLDSMVGMYRTIGFSEEDGLIKTITDYYEQFYQLVSEKDNPELMRALLEVKILEQNYFNQTENAEGEIDNKINNLKDVISAADFSNEDNDTFTTGLLRYQQSLSTVSRTKAQAEAIKASFEDVTNEVTNQTQAVGSNVEVINDGIKIEQQNSYRNMFIIFGITVLLTLIAIIFSGRYLLKIITNSIQTIKNGAEQIGNGDLAHRIPITTKDELADLAITFNNMTDKMEQSMVKVQHASLVLNDSSANLAASSEESAAQTEQVNTAINHVASGAQKQADQIEESMVLIKNVSHALANTNTASEGIAKALEDAKLESNLGLQTVDTLEQTSTSFLQLAGHLTEQVQYTAEQTKQITSIVSAIEDIADSTNLLALNAAIESARAGESGKGFSVVAQEVRKLAERSKKEAQEINQMIHQINGQMVSLSEDAAKFDTYQETQGNAVNQTKQAFNKITNQIYDITNTLDDVQVSLGDVDKLNTNLDEKLQEISVISEESVSSAEEVAASSDSQAQAIDDVNHSALDLQELSQLLAAEVEQFSIRANPNEENETIQIPDVETETEAEPVQEDYNQDMPDDDEFNGDHRVTTAFDEELEDRIEEEDPNQPEDELLEEPSEESINYQDNDQADKN